MNAASRPAERYARDILGFPRNALLLPRDRVYMPVTCDLVVPHNLLATPFVIYGLRADERQPPFAYLADIYPVPYVLAVSAERCVVWEQSGIDRSYRVAANSLQEFKHRREVQGPDLRAVSGSRLASEGCADQDYIAACQARALRLLLPHMRGECALWLLMRILHGLALRPPLSQQWRTAESLFVTAIENSCRVLPPNASEARLKHDLPPCPQTAAALAACLAPIRLSAVAYDLWGPLYESVVSTGTRRSKGAYMTPPAIVDLVLWLATEGSGADHQAPLDGLWLDPAAGTGAFPVRLAALARRQGPQSLHRLAERLHALETDDLSATVLRLNLAFQLALSMSAHDSADDVDAGCLHGCGQGDALETYTPFSAKSDRPYETYAGATMPMAAITARSDFGYVVGNPPYIGESRHKTVFSKYRTHPFWSHYCEGKMDLLQLFITLALSKVQNNDGGRVCFVTSAYWLTADGAGRLRDLILSQARVHTVVFFPKAALFTEAPGHESIVILLERCRDDTIRAASRPRLIYVTDTKSGSVADRLAAALSGELAPGIQVRHSVQAQRELLGNRWHFATDVLDVEASAALNGPPLMSAFAIKQGVAPGAQRVDRSALARLGADWAATHNIRLGEGIFVLTDEELAALDLPAEEAAFVRPFVKNSAIRRYAVMPPAPLWLVYLRHDQDHTHCRRLLAHLERFRPLLEQKREYATGARQWYHLHWPRDERMFHGEKLLTAHRRDTPAFAWSDEPLYAATDVYYILPSERPDIAAPPLLALAGILNSELAAYWFAHHAKRKGGQKEFFSGVVNRFPLPHGTAIGLEKEYRRLARCVRYLHESEKRLAVAGADRNIIVARQERRQRLVDESVYRLYRLPAAVETHIRSWAAKTKPPAGD